jgi:hypothetical protein
MGKKAKAKKTASFKKVDASHYRAIAAALKKGKAPETSGELIRARLVEGKLNAEQIAAEVRKRYPGSTAKKSDVYWNRGRLKKEGVKLPA